MDDYPPQLPIQSVQAVSLPEQIYTQLRRAILTGDLPAGARLLEMDIAARAGASQASVRAALAQLEADGLVERRSRSGTFITAVDDDEVRALFQVRAQVEALAAQRAVARLASPDFDELERLIAVMHAAAKDDDMLALGEHDLLFHRRIVSAAGSNALLRAWLPLYSPIQRYMTQNHRRHFPDLAEIADLHAPIIAALRARNPQRAAETIEKHILLSIEKLHEPKPAADSAEPITDATQINTDA